MSLYKWLTPKPPKGGFISNVRFYRLVAINGEGIGTRKPLDKMIELWLCQ